ncbi:MAG: hypothetical protein AAF556_13380, partial [Pseudomonadota bacterium]
MVQPQPNYEFDRVIPLARLDDETLTVSEIATRDECAAIAGRLDVPAVERLSVEAELSLRNKGRFVAISAVAKAKLTLTCVVTLEPFEQDFEEVIELRLAVPGRTKQDRAPVPHEELSLDEAEALFPEYLDN